MNFYSRASEHPSVYVVEEKRLCWPLTGPAGCLTLLRARSTIDLAASDASAARAKIQTPSGSGRLALISPASAARRSVLAPMLRMRAASVSLSHASTQSPAALETEIEECGRH